MATLAVTGVPPFSLFQSEFTVLSAGLAAGRSWSAGLFVLGLVTVFAGFLMHMAKLNLGRPACEAGRGAECPWKIGAMLLVAVPVVVFGLMLPAPIYELVRRAAVMMGGDS
jgi:hydrogenase-4 component F